MITAYIFLHYIRAAVALNLIQDLIGDGFGRRLIYISIQSGLFRRSFHRLAFDYFGLDQLYGELDEPRAVGEQRRMLGTGEVEGVFGHRQIILLPVAHFREEALLVGVGREDGGQSSPGRERQALGFIRNSRGIERFGARFPHFTGRQHRANLALPDRACSSYLIGAAPGWPNPRQRGGGTHPAGRPAARVKSTRLVGARS